MSARPVRRAALGKLSSPRLGRVFDRQRLFERLDALRDGPVTLVFSDGRREIRDLDPLIVNGDAWRPVPGGLLYVGPEPLLEPGPMTAAKVTVAGVGLLNEAGEQVGWAPFVERIDVPRNGRVKVPAKSILFTF